MPRDCSERNRTGTRTKCVTWPDRERWIYGTRLDNRMDRCNVESGDWMYPRLCRRTHVAFIATNSTQPLRHISTSAITMALTATAFINGNIVWLQRKRKSNASRPHSSESTDALHAECMKIGTSTARADRSSAEKAITRMYELIGEKPPAFIWFDSPATAILGRALLLSLAKNESSLGASLQNEVHLLQRVRTLCSEMAQKSYRRRMPPRWNH